MGPLLSIACRDSVIVAKVTYNNGGGRATYVFTPQGVLMTAFMTGGPTWRKDSVVRDIYRPGPDFNHQTVTLHRRDGEQRLLLEQFKRRNGQTLTVSVDDYDPVLEIPGFRAEYRLDERQRIVEARITKRPAAGFQNDKDAAVYTYEYGVAGACVVRDTTTKRVVAEILPRKKRTLVRLMEKRNKGYEFVFGGDGLLRAKIYRNGALGRQTEFHQGRKGLKISGMSFGLSVSAGPSPRALWRSVTIKGKTLDEEIKLRITRQLLESLAFRGTDYRRYFPRGYAPAERAR